MTRTKVVGRRKVAKVMGEFKRGTLRSSSGDKVTNPKQAIAIGLSEQREADQETRKQRRRRRRGKGRTSQRESRRT